MDAAAPRRFIGTFHKTGTALFESILMTARQQGVLVPWLMHEGEAPPAWDVAFDYHTKALLKSLDPDPATARYVICIRDPRDVIISAAYYHCKAPEEWLHKPDPEFGGMSYQEKINALPTMTDRFLFEMEHSAYWQIQGMLQVPLAVPSVCLTRLETLVRDHDLWEFHKIFAFLQFETGVMVDLMKIAYGHSLFSGKVKQTVHARSGKPAQYLAEFDDRARARYDEVFGDAAVRLGYPA